MMVADFVTRQQNGSPLNGEIPGQNHSNSSMPAHSALLMSSNSSGRGSPQNSDNEYSQNGFDLSSHLKRKELFSQRKQREFIPDNKKDDSYWDRRRRNNEAAKRSREKRRFNDMVLEQRVVELTKENHVLKAQLDAIKNKYNICGENLVSVDQIMATLPTNEQVLSSTKRVKISNPQPIVFPTSRSPSAQPPSPPTPQLLHQPHLQQQQQSPQQQQQQSPQQQQQQQQPHSQQAPVIHPNPNVESPPPGAQSLVGQQLTIQHTNGAHYGHHSPVALYREYETLSGTPLHAAAAATRTIEANPKLEVIRSPLSRVELMDRDDHRDPREAAIAEHQQQHQHHQPQHQHQHHHQQQQQQHHHHQHSHHHPHQQHQQQQQQQQQQHHHQHPQHPQHHQRDRDRDRDLDRDEPVAAAAAPTTTTPATTVPRFGSPTGASHHQHAITAGVGPTHIPHHHPYSSPYTIPAGYPAVAYAGALYGSPPREISALLTANVLNLSRRAPSPYEVPSGTGSAASASSSGDDEHDREHGGLHEHANSLPVKLRHKSHLGDKDAATALLALQNIKQEPAHRSVSPAWDDGDGSSDERDSGISTEWPTKAEQKMMVPLPVSPPMVATATGTTIAPSITTTTTIVSPPAVALVAAAVASVAAAANAASGAAASKITSIPASVVISKKAEDNIHLQSKLARLESEVATIKNMMISNTAGNGFGVTAAAQ